MLTDRSTDDTCSLALSLFGNHLSHNSGIHIIEVTDWFVEEGEIERLAQCADESHALLLSEREELHFLIELIADTQHIKVRKNLFLRFEIGNTVLQMNILERSQLGKYTQLLKQDTQRMLANINPLIDTIIAGIFFIEFYFTLIIFSIAINKATQRRLSGARCRFYKISFAFLESNILKPDVRMNV